VATNTRLTADDWLWAGYAIVAEEGINALKLDRLWARSDETVAAAVHSADRRPLNAIREAFRDFDFDAEEADR
jgi:L-alanine-DL-glutamate epimerase-like enolase superfamily enzyme